MAVVIPLASSIRAKIESGLWIERVHRKGFSRTILPTYSLLLAFLLLLLGPAIEAQITVTQPIPSTATIRVDANKTS